MWNNKKNEICYIVGIAKIRDIREIINTMEYAEDVKLYLAGKFNEKEVEFEVNFFDTLNKVNELGFLNREEIVNVLDRFKAGLTLHPIINYLDPQAIAKSIEHIINNPKEVEEMGLNGRKAVEDKLLKVYEGLNK